MKTLFFLLILNFSLFAQPYVANWYNQNPYNLDNRFGIQFIDENIGWMFPGNNKNKNFFLKTTDGGNNWHYTGPFDLPDVYPPLPYFFANSDTGFYFDFSFPRKIWKTTNAGNNWSEIYSFNTTLGLNPLGVFFLNGSKGWLVYRTTTPYILHILKTTNGGMEWSEISQIQEAYYFPVYVRFFNEETGFLVRILSPLWNTYITQLYKTTDGGFNWTLVSEIPFYARINFYSESEGWAVFNGNLYFTNNGGWNWYQKNFTQNCYINRLAILGDSVIVVAGKDKIVSRLNHLFVSKDGGSLWTISSRNDIPEIYHSTIVSSENIYLQVSNPHYLFKATNMGTLIEKVPVGPTYNLMAFISLQGGAPVTFGWKQNPLSNLYESAILHLPHIWRPKSVLSNIKLKCFYIKNNSEILIGGYDYSNGGNSVIFKCNSSGDILEIKNLLSDQIINSIDFLNENIGYAVGNNGMILKTIDGGNNWNQMNSITNENLNIVKFTSQYGLIAGSNGLLLRSTDGGENWTQTEVNTIKEITSIHFHLQNQVWIVGKDGLILKSDNSGLTWTPVAASNDFDFNYVTAKSVIHIGIYGNNKVENTSVFMESHNGGLSWNTGFIPGHNSINHIYQENNSKTWAVGDSGYISYTNGWFVPVELISFNADYSNNNVNIKWSTASELNNFGFEIEKRLANSDWRVIGFKHGHGTTTELNQYSFIDDLFGNNSNKLYYRLKQIDNNGSYEYSEIIEVDIPPFTYLLTQNYPNPFNPSTVISYQLPEAGRVSLKIYDLLGREIASLVNEEKQAGHFEVTFDASLLSSGLYFYRLKTEKFIETKKMMVIK